ncbi:MAG: hypothetical protein HUK25_04980 [Treponema sp.]|nr:hypothetical protein [Treponema sp.]
MNFFTKGLAASNMVLLQNEKNCVIGCAPKDSTVTMSFRGKTYACKAEKDGQWKIEFNAGGVCESETMILSCSESDEKIIFENVAVGEVWLCSGQSNMQLQMERLKFTYPEEFKNPKDNNLRMITIPVSFSFDGEKDCIENPDWKIAEPDTLAAMSGTAYFFAKKIKEDLGVPVGIINASQGGTPITAWMNAESMEGIGAYTKRLQELKQKDYIENQKCKEQKAAEEWNEKILSEDLGIKESWEKLSFSDLGDSWQTVNIPAKFDFIENGGIVWFKKEIELTEKELEHLKKNGARIWMGTIQDADRVYVNGVQVGVTYYVYPPRRYGFDANLLHEGKNTITLRVQQNGSWAKMFFWDEKHYALASDDVRVIPVAVRNVEQEKGVSPLDEKSDKGVYISLKGEWKSKTGCQVLNAPSSTFFEYEPEALYNAMLSPCFTHAVRGALWYQGESNALGWSEYAELLCRMIKLWRIKFTYCPESEMPFVIMQLPLWGNVSRPNSNTVFSDWALLRESQNKASEKSPDTALAVTIDAGEWNDLHPEKKKTGGTRAAKMALRLAYKKDYPLPAKILGAQKTEEGFIVSFESEKKLECFASEGECADLEKNDSIVRGFTVLYENNGIEQSLVCSAELSGEKTVKVKIPEEIKTVKEVRYLWANCPECVNLYAGGIPVMPGRVIL